MRIRATVAAAALAGAVALTAAVIPAAQAAGPAASHQGWQQLAQKLVAGHAATTHSASIARSSAATPADDGAPMPLAVTFSKVKVNGGKPIVVGTTNAVHVPYTYTLTANGTVAAPIDLTAPDSFSVVYLYSGSPTSASGNALFGDNPGSCKITSVATAPTGVTTWSCSGKVDIVPKGELTTADAGAHWHAAGLAAALNGQDPDSKNFDPTKTSEADQYSLAAVTLQRYSELTVNASPEPVHKGKTVTIVGKLSRANWDTHKYAGYTVQPVKLQFRKAGSSTYTTLKTIKSDSHGNLKTTYKASVSGYWRYTFAGTSTTPAVSAVGDYVAVKK